MLCWQPVLCSPVLLDYRRAQAAQQMLATDVGYGGAGWIELRYFASVDKRQPIIANDARLGADFSTQLVVRFSYEYSV